MPEPSPLPPTRVRWRIFALACGTSLLLYLHRYTWNIVGPEIQKDFRLTHTQAGLLFSLFYYTYAGGQIPSGLIIDRFGPHVVLGASILAWSTALGALGQTSKMALLGAWRLLFGLGQAACYPALNKVSRSWFPVARRTLLQGWVATTFGRGGGALSPIVLGTVLMGWLGMSWRSALGVLAIAGLAYGAALIALFRSTPAEHPGVNDAERALIEEGSPPSTSASRSAFPAGRAWRNRSLWFFVLQQFLDAGSDVAFVSLIGTYFLRARGYEMAKTGWLASLPLWGGAIGGIVGGWLNDAAIARTGSRRWSRSVVGCVGKVVGCIALALVVRQAGGVEAACVLMAAKFFSDWSQPTAWGTCTDMGGRHSATVFSIINTAGTIGGVIMPIIFGQVLDLFTTQSTIGGQNVPRTDWGPLFALLATMYLGSGLCWLMVDCTRRIDDEP